MRYCGIDPGLTGGVGFVDEKEGEITAFSSALLPRYQVRYGVDNKTNNYVDPMRLHEIVAAQHPDVIVVERQIGYPNQSSVSTHTSGINYGLVLSLWTLKIPMHLVAPDQWKKRLKLSASKEEATELCADLFGRLAPKRDGPAEALLIAWYGILEELGK
jgi:Holliday junction resolvasome RuvABC endonuclease subunit